MAQYIARHVTETSSLSATYASITLLCLRDWAGKHRRSFTTWGAILPATTWQLVRSCSPRARPPSIIQNCAACPEGGDLRHNPLQELLNNNSGHSDSSCRALASPFGLSTSQRWPHSWCQTFWDVKAFSLLSAEQHPSLLPLPGCCLNVGLP